MTPQAQSYQIERNRTLSLSFELTRPEGCEGDVEVMDVYYQAVTWWSSTSGGRWSTYVRAPNSGRLMRNTVGIASDNASIIEAILDLSLLEPDAAITRALVEGTCDGAPVEEFITGDGLPEQYQGGKRHQVRFGYRCMGAFQLGEMRDPEISRPRYSFPRSGTKEAPAEPLQLAAPAIEQVELGMTTTPS
jgi:hypothetical protein